MLRRLLTVRGRFVAAGSGAALPLSFAPFGLWWLAPLLLAVLFLLVEGASSRERTLRGFWFAFGTFSTGTYWLYISIHDFGGVAPPIAVALCGALILLMALYGGAWAFLTGLIGREAPAWQFLAVLPALWVAVEWARSWLFSGFPWLTLGYGQIDGPLAAWAPVVGVHGVSLLVAFIAGALAMLLIGPQRRRIAGLGALLGLALFSALLAGRDWTTPVGGTREVALVQGGISQERKWLLESWRRPRKFTGTSLSASTRPTSLSGLRRPFPRSLTRSEDFLRCTE